MRGRLGLSRIALGAALGAVAAAAFAESSPAPQSPAPQPPASEPRPGPSEADGSPADGPPAGEREPSPTLAVPADLSPDGTWIFIDKSERRMVVADRGWTETYRIALGQSPEGPKEVEGDGRTPEGELYVCQRVVSDRFHRFLGLSYPTPEDATRGALSGLLLPGEVNAIVRAHARRARPPWNTRLGGAVGIHGWGRRRATAELHARGADWTDGCIGVTNDEIDRIYARVRLGTRVVIAP